MHYYGTRLSENISRREPEGYLLCLNVPVARTGTQDYLPEELGLPSGSSFIPVLRPEAEVFSPETIASFEGMPVTNDHPPEGVDTSNIRALQKGHAHNVRRGSGEESDLLMADLIITDPHLIDLILEDGKREISCGYTYELCEENGQYIQRKIRGNHVAVVDAGRAGHRVSIKDEHPVQISDLGEPPVTASGGSFAGGEVRRNKRAPRWGVAPIKPAENRCRATGTRDWRAAGDDRAAVTIALNKTTISERSTPKMKKSLVKKLVRMAKDGDPEAIEALAEMLETVTESEAESAETVAEVAEVVEEVAEQPAAVVETPEATVVVDEATLADVISRLDQIISLLTPAPAADQAADEDPVEEIVEAVSEAVEEAVTEAAAEEPEVAAELAEGTSPEEISAIVEEIVEPVLSETIEDEPAGDACGDPEETSATDAPYAEDALRAALTAIRPALARMPKKQRRKVAADIAARMRKQSGRKTADGKTYAALAAASRRKPAAVDADLGRRIMERRNPNYRH